jgi:hypothetical protein
MTTTKQTDLIEGEFNINIKEKTHTMPCYGVRLTKEIETLIFQNPQDVRITRTSENVFFFFIKIQRNSR